MAATVALAALVRVAGVHVADRTPAPPPCHCSSASLCAPVSIRHDKEIFGWAAGKYAIRGSGP